MCFSLFYLWPSDEVEGMDGQMDKHLGGVYLHTE